MADASKAYLPPLKGNCSVVALMLPKILDSVADMASFNALPAKAPRLPCEVFRADFGDHC